MCDLLVAVEVRVRRPSRYLDSPHVVIIIAIDLRLASVVIVTVENTGVGSLYLLTCLSPSATMSKDAHDVSGWVARSELDADDGAGLAAGSSRSFPVELLE